MNVIVQPPSEIRPGSLLHPPIVVRLEGYRAQNATEIVNVNDTNIWALASVVSADGMVALAPPQTDLLSGTLVDSVHTSSVDEGRRVMGYMTFSNLAINEAGNYRIRVSLVRMPTIEDSEAINVQSIVTRVIRVDSRASAPSLGPEERDVLTSLKERGVVKSI
ncbi:hypothetical protein MMC29_005471 [Sticta canariensis]|nr:hypothetical protein [Sticta canariensis]